MSERQRISDEVISQWKKELSEVRDDEVLRIVSGELNCDLFRAIGPDIERALDEKEFEIRIIAGPVFSVEGNDKEGIGENYALKLAKKGRLKLWISPTRQLYHFRVYGDRIAYQEKYHEPLAIERSGAYTQDRMVILKLTHQFEQLIKVLNLSVLDEATQSVTADKATLLRVKDQCGRNYDFLTGEEFREKNNAFHASTLISLAA